MSTEKPDRLRVAIVGAGWSGLIALKECLAAGFDAEAFDLRSTVGGAWVYQPCSLDDADRPTAKIWSSMYDGTILNSSRDTTAFTDFPADPARYPDYFKHNLMARYLGEYADHFNLRPRIRLNTNVLECIPSATIPASWTVRLQRVADLDTDDAAPVLTEMFDAIMATTGHQNTPIIPEFCDLDHFGGQFFHSHFYRSPTPFAGKKVVVIGFGPSAVDIACEIAPLAAQTHIVTRRGGWIIPRYLLGKPVEAWDNRATQVWLPMTVAQWLQTKLLQAVEVKPPKEMRPSHHILEQNPVVRGDLTEKVVTGLITIQRASVDHFTATGLQLSNDIHVDANVVIAATGYRNLDFPYLPADAARDPASDDADQSMGHRLYKLIMNPHYPTLFFIGYIEAFGPHGPIAEAQVRHAVALLSNRIARPSEKRMVEWIDSFHAHQKRHYIPSPRHGLTVHSVHYIDELLRPLGAVPTFPRLLGRIFTRNPFRAVQVLLAVWFGVSVGAQWRLCGDGRSEQLAVETLLRLSRGGRTLSEGEISCLAATAARD